MVSQAIRSIYLIRMVISISLIPHTRRLTMKLLVLALISTQTVALFVPSVLPSSSSQLSCSKRCSPSPSPNSVLLFATRADKADGLFPSDDSFYLNAAAATDNYTDLITFPPTTLIR